MEAYFANDGSIFSLVFAKMLKDNGYQLHSSYGRFTSDSDADKIARAKDIADRFCVSHDVVTINAWPGTEAVLTPTLFGRVAIHMIATSPAVHKYLSPKRDAGLDITGDKVIFFGMQVTQLELDSIMSKTMKKGGWIFVAMPETTEEEAYNFARENDILWIEQ